MPRKHLVEPLPKDVRVIDYAPGEFKPLFVSSKDVEKVVIGWSKKTAANLRSQKKGPRYYLVGGTPYYRIEDLDEYFSRYLVKTTD